MYRCSREFCCERECCGLCGVILFWGCSRLLSPLQRILAKKFGGGMGGMPGAGGLGGMDLNALAKKFGGGMGGFKF